MLVYNFKVCIDILHTYTYIIHTLYIHYTYIIHTLYLHYTYIIHTLYIHYTYIVTLYIHYTHIIHTLYVHYTYIIQNKHFLGRAIQYDVASGTWMCRCAVKLVRGLSGKTLYPHVCFKNITVQARDHGAWGWSTLNCRFST